MQQRDIAPLRCIVGGLLHVDLNDGRLDVSFGVFPKLPRGLERVTVAETSLSLVCPAGHPLLRRPSITLAEIAQQLGCSDGAVKRYLNEAMGRLRIRLDVSREVNT